jgi:hypothetical protein
MKDMLSSSKTLVLTRATRRNIPEDAILHLIKDRTDQAVIPEPSPLFLYPSVCIFIQQRSFGIAMPKNYDTTKLSKNILYNVFFVGG